MSEQEVSKLFGERLKRRRMACGLNQRQCADRVGMPAATLSRLEKGDYQAVSLERVRHIAQALSTSTDFLFGLTNDPGPVPDRPCPAAGRCLEGATPLPVAHLPEETDHGECISFPY